MQKRFNYLLLFLFIFSTSFSAQNSIQLSPLGVYETGIFNDGGSEISAYDPVSKKMFVTNASDNTITVLDVTNPSNPIFVEALDMSSYGAGANSVAFKNGYLAVAMEAEVKQDNGKIVFFDSDGNYVNDVTVGPLPDMVAFSPDGTYVVTANEGEPNDDYTFDPEGSVSIIDISGGIANLTQGDVANAGFSQFNANYPAGVRVFGPGATLAQDMEPEYIAFSSNGANAYVVCQENNAAAVVSLPAKTITTLVPLGYKDHSLTSNALDASNDDDMINITNWPVFGLYLPDAIATYNVNGIDYIVSANEGDSRDYDGFSEEERVKDVTLDPARFPNAVSLQEDENLGRLKITNTMGDFDGDNDYDTLFSYGARSFSIWNSNTGTIIYDSGSDFETITAAAYPDDFNSTNDENDSFDDRSDDKGPEPEGLAIGEIDGEYYAFIGFERMGGIAVYNISNPVAPEFVQYITTRDFSGDAAAGTAGNLGPEGLIFIPAGESPNGKNLLVVTYEISGSVQIFAIDEGVVPVELASFSASPVENGVMLNWSTASENNNKGFDIERSEDGKNFNKIASVAGNGTTNEENNYTYIDHSKFSGHVFYRLKQVDLNGEFEYSNIVEVNVGIPGEFSLAQNYPNPFNPSTKISFSISREGPVSLKVYNVLGKEVATLVNENIVPGYYSVNFSGANLSSGVYLYRLESAGLISVRKMNLVK